MSDVVVDASAILALLQEEPGAELVRETLGREDCAMSAVNLAEVVTKLTDYGVPPEAIAEALSPLALEIRPFDADNAVATGLLRAQARQAGLSLADRACLALARELGNRVLTADRQFAAVDLGLEVTVIR